MMVTSMDWNKFFYSVSKQGLDRKVDRWKFTQNGRPHHKLIIEQVEPITFQFGPTGLWIYYGAAVLYRSEWTS
jgi:hypothetical protein